MACTATPGFHSHGRFFVHSLVLDGKHPGDFNKEYWQHLDKLNIDVFTEMDSGMQQDVDNRARWRSRAFDSSYLKHLVDDHPPGVKMLLKPHRTQKTGIM